jgi:tellurite resistance protein TerB
MTERHSLSSAAALESATYCPDHHDEEFMRALVTAGALVALADGRVDPLERDELLNFIDRQRLVLTISRDEIGRVFDRRVQQIKDQYDEADIAGPLRPLTGLSLASAVVGAAERVAAADSRIHPREVEALNLIRRIMRTPSGRPDTPIPRAPTAQSLLFITALAMTCAGAATIIGISANELARWTAAQKTESVTSGNIDNYLELFADGPGRGWYVSCQRRCDVRGRDPPGQSYEPPIAPPTPPPN